MHIALLSDVHANFEALAAVAAELDAADVAACWYLGDIVGYGPEPVECLLWLSELVHAVAPESWVLGNHDAMLAGLLAEYDLAETNGTPRQAIELNRAALLAQPWAAAFWREQFVDDRARPRRHTLDGLDYTLVHGAQAHDRFYHRYNFPWETLYQADEFAILAAGATATGRPQAQLFGHTHVPTLVRLEGGRPQPVWVEPDVTYDLGQLSLVNPGSVGQPRDLDRRAAYAVLDTVGRTVTFRRVVYDWRATAHRLVDGGYPDSLIRRLIDAPLPVDGANPDWPAWRDHFQALAERAS
ncbi:MAG: metallophosphoesterase family protein [Candidatus Promineofilum sp.]|nr:metallophosphoesterase family protein [Promineifilum sp.]